jgi:tryptophan halogenase
VDRSIRKVVIVGRDAAAWLSALTLQRSFGRGENPVEVELVELPSLLSPQDAYLTLPSQQAFHRLLGLDETRLLRASKGMYSLAQRFSNWSGADAPFMHAYDSQGISLSHVDFLHYWLRARSKGLAVPLEEFSIGAAAAKHGRFLVFNESTEAFSNATYGYNLDAIPYLRAIGKTALDLGLRHRAGRLSAVEHDSGRVTAIRLEDGTTITGDLFVDATGSEAALAAQLDDTAFDDWSDWLPCDRIMSASASLLEPIPAFSQVSAFRGGWVGIFPLLDRTALVGVYSAGQSSDADMAQTMSALSGMRLAGDVVTTRFRAGARRRHWIGNCVAVGDTAVSLEPLDAVQLHLLHTGLSHLVSLFPVDRDNMPEAEIFNDKMTCYAVGVRDFQAAHYKLNRRFDEPLWDEVRERDVPETLERKLRLFASRGIVPLGEEETFQQENWTALFVGHGLIPQAYDPLVDGMPEQEQIAHFQQMLGFIASEVQAMPSLQAHLELNSPSSGSDYIF